MESRPQPYELLFLVCVNERPDGKACCADGDGMALKEWLKAEVKARGYRGRVRVSQSGCLDRCSEGPNIFVFPAGVWHSHVTLEDLPQILERHLAGVEPEHAPTPPAASE